MPALPAPPLVFEDVYREHFSFVWRNARRLGVRDLAIDDVAQEVFLVVHRRLREFEGRSSLRSWLYAILAHVVRNHRRAAIRKPGEGDGDAVFELTDDQGRNPEENTQRAEAAAIVYRALDALDDDKREVFVLTELEQMSGREIADALGANVNTIHARLRAARQVFADAIERAQHVGRSR